MKNLNIAKTLNVKPWKRVLCVLLSVIIAFGTFVALTVGSSRLQDWLGIQSMLSAYASEFIDTKGAIGVDKESMLENSSIVDLKYKDGSNTIYLFSEPISYTDEHGNLKTKDISVEKQTDKELKAKGYEYTNGQNDYRINFSKESSKGVYIKFGNSNYSIIPQSDKATVGNESTSKILTEQFEDFEYKNIYGEGTNLKFYPQLNGIKDEIILNSNINKNVFSFKLKTENCDAVLNEDGTITLMNDDNGVVQTFSAPYAYDSEYIEEFADEHYTDCKYSLEETAENEYILSITVDGKWLNSKNTVYPVVIDPTTSNVYDSADAAVFSKYASNNYGNEQTGCFGKSSDYGYGRVYEKFNIPSAIKKGATINYAYHWVRETTGRTNSTYVRPFLVTSSWSETGITWSNKAGYETTTNTNWKNINSKSTDNPDNPYWYNYNLVNCVKKWINGTANNGVVFVSGEEVDEVQKYEWRAFASRTYSTSSMRPYTVISYENDTTAPTITSVTGNPTSWTKNNVTLTVNGAKDNSGGAGLHSTPYSFSTTKGSYSWQSGNTKTFSSNCTVYVYVRDVLGNIRLVSTQTINKIDKTAPTIPSVSGNPTAWTTGSVKLTASSSDGGSGIKDYSFSTTKNSYNWQTQNYKSFSSNTTVYVYARDNAGNISSPKEVVINKITSNPDYLLDLSFYEENDKIGIVNPRNNDDPIQYKIGANGKWIDYIIPFALPINEDVTIYAKFKDTSKTISQSFSSKSNEYIGGFTESGIDLTITFSGVSFDVSRYYNSYNNKWFFSTNTKIDELKNNTISLLLPNSSTLIFTKKDDYSYINKKSNYTLSVLHNDSGTVGYTVNMDDIIYSYNKLGLLISITDNNENSINFEYKDNSLSRIYYGIDEVREYIIESSDGLIDSITTPLGETIKYLYDLEHNLTDVFYDKETLQIIRDDNIILGHYEYKDNKMSVCNTDEIIYANNKLSKVISADGSYVDYNISIVNDSEVYGEKSQNVSVFKIVSTTSNGKISTSYYNNALNLIKYNNSDDTYELCEFDIYQNLISKEDNNSSAIYKYNGIVLNSSVIDKIETKYNEYGSIISQKDEDTTTTYSYLNDGKTLEKIESVSTERTGSNIDSKVTYSLTNKYQNGKLQSTTEKIFDSITDNFGISTILYNDNNTVSSITSESTINHENNITSTEKETTSLLYDDFGNIIRGQYVNEDEDETKLSINNYEYDDINRKIMVTDNTGDIEEKCIYDSVDNIIYENKNDNVSRTIYDGYSRTIRKITSEDYDENCDGLISEIKQDSYSDDSVGYTYIYDENGNIQSETDRDGLTTSYSYYENSSNVKTESFDSYVFTYDKNGNTIKETISGQLYAEYKYNSDNNPTIVSYGNGQSIKYVYDNNGNLTKQFHNDEDNPYIEYTYNKNNGNQVAELDNEINQEAKANININSNYILVSKINYDTEQKTVYSNNKATVYSLDNNKLYSYDLETTASNNKDSSSYSYASDSSVVINSGNAEDTISINDSNNITTIQELYDTVEIIENEIAYYNVVSHNGNSVMGVNYSYDQEGNVISEEYNVNGKEFEYKYTYDDNGKILSYSLDDNQKVTYQYDEITNAILREDIRTDSHYLSYEYSYDSRGNLVASKEYDFYGYCGTTNYSVDDSIWLDELSSIETKQYTLQFLYDENGNPVSIDDISFDWTSGRLLDSVYTQNEQGEKEILLSYTYDEKGIRTSKTYRGVTTYFTSIDGMITSQYEIDENGSIANEIIFIYNSDNQLIAFTYNGETYYYLKNHMDDVIAVLDDGGNIIVEYVYDAWGNPYYSKYYGEDDANRIDDINPMLYRSYYYDMELCAYYLQSRYYMPTYHRFLNSDIPEMVRQKRHEYAGTNLFTYCCNNPINKYDPNGTWSNDVHDGYNPDTENHFYYLDFDGIKEYYGTYYWATIIGYNYSLARALGTYDNFVDDAYGSTGPNWKEYDKWHFYTIDGKDVRFKISHDEQSKAKEYFDKATTAYYKYQNYKKLFGVSSSYTSKQYGFYKTNLDSGIFCLGISLHPVQDAYAHIRAVCKQFDSIFPGRWYHLSKKVDKAELHTYAVLGPTASKTLEILLTFYNSYYILRLDKSYSI